MLVLLPPSEGKTAPRRGAGLDLGSLGFPVLTEPRERLLAALQRLCHQDPLRAASVLGLGPAQAHLVARNATLDRAPAARADRVYTGVLYDALGAATLSPPAKRRAAARVAVVSALFGLLAPGDRIPAYRLSGDTTLPGLGTVSGVWRERLGRAVTDRLGDGLLVDLRSTTYAGFWRPPAELAPRVATVRVLRDAAGARTVVSHLNKATKGRLVRGLLEHGARPASPRALASAWRDLGWSVEEQVGRGGTRLDVVVTAL